jgi:hypothetical protein
VKIIPCSLRDANAFVSAFHRHSQPVRGHKFSVGLESDGEIIGYGIAGRPVSRVLDDGFTLEILRVCVHDGYNNGCSMLYGALRKAGFAMGYTRIITYTLSNELGSSLKGAGFRPDKARRAGTWDCPSRPRDANHHVLSDRIRWISP